jgi:hypothetical protein
MKILDNKPLFIVLLVVIVIFGIFRWESNRARDYYQFWVVGQATKSMDLTNIYGDQDRHRIGEYFFDEARLNKASLHLLSAAKYRRFITPAGTPFLYSVFRLVSTGNYDLDYAIFRISSFAAFLLSIIVLCEMFLIPWLVTVVLLLFFTQLFGPFRLDVMEGNINQIQVGIITFILWLRARKKGCWAESVSGVILGLLIMFKPNLAPLFIFILMGTFFAKSHKQAFILAGSSGIGLALGYGLPMLLFGRVCNWEQWIAAFPKMVFSSDYFKRSFLGLFFGVHSMSVFLIFASLLVLGPFLLMYIKSRSSRGYYQYADVDHIMMGLGVCVYLLASTLVHFHYFALIVPFLLFLFRPWRGERDLKSVFLGIAVFVLMDIRALSIGDGNDPFYSDWRFAFIGVVILYGWALYQLAIIDKPGVQLA